MHQYFGIVSDFGILLFGASAVILAGGSVWLRLKRFEREGRTRPGLDESSLRLERIEHLVESLALETERMAEAQRFSAKLIADGMRISAPERSPTRIVTPH